MDTQPKIPTLKDSQKPQVKVRGMEAGITLFDRLKQFKKKDLAFILAGLGTLFMAPLAEHFMMSPESGDGTLQQGWGKGGSGKGMFDGGGSSPYEPGTSGLAPGGPTGGGSDIITPLNVRDPSALVMGPGSTQQPPTNSAMSGTPPPTAPGHSDSDLKDALSASARGAAAGTKAAGKTLLPIPKIALGGSGLRGLGVASGGSSSSAGGGPISSAGLVSGKANAGGGLSSVRPTTGYNGVARGQTNGSHGGLDALKAAADAAGGVFNRGSASSAANEAANANMGAGGTPFGGNGAGGTGSTDKAGGGDSQKNSKNLGESLAFLKAKAMQEAQIALWAKEQEAGDNKLEALKIRNSMAESIAGSVAQGIGSGITSCLSGKGCMGAGGGGSYNCENMNGETVPALPASSVADSFSAACTPAASGSKDAPTTPMYIENGVIKNCSATPIYQKCTGGDSSSGDNSKGGPGGQGQNKGADHAIATMGDKCKSTDKTAADPGEANAPARAFLGAHGKALHDTAVVRAASDGTGTPDCKAPDDPNNIKAHLKKSLAATTKEKDSTINTSIDNVPKQTKDKKSPAQSLQTGTQEAEAAQQKTDETAETAASVDNYLATNQDMAVPDSLKGSMNLGGARLAYSGDGGVKQNYEALGSGSRQLNDLLKKDLDPVAQDGGTVDQVMKLNTDLASKIKSYNDTANSYNNGGGSPQATILTANSSQGSSQGASQDSSQGGGNGGGADLSTVQQTIQTAQNSVQTLSQKLDQFINSPSATTAMLVQQSDADTATQSVQQAQKVQISNLKMLASNSTKIVNTATGERAGAAPTGN